ncbi:caspase family protein [Streptomyces sp. NPDC001165]|uniref:caspase, EACC1-associated type n=1 Tax=Streptomyces sp. NPDC001165 TaxID=3364546 RepID=UPI0036A42D64
MSTSNSLPPLGAYTRQGKVVLSLAKAEAAKSRSPYVGSEHLALGFVAEAISRTASPHPDFGRALLEAARRLVLERGAAPLKVALPYPKYNGEAKEVLRRSLSEAQSRGLSERITPGDILAALNAMPDCLGSVILKTTPDISIGSADADFASDTVVAPFVDLGAQWVSGRIRPSFGYAYDVDRMIRILTKSARHNPMLVGGGRAAAAILCEFVQRVLSDPTVPASLHDVPILLGNPDLLEKTGLNGLPEPPAILAVGYPDASLFELLDTLTTRPGMRVIAMVSQDFYEATVALAPSMGRNFEPMEIQETTVEEAADALSTQAKGLSQHHNVVFDPAALLAAARRAERELPDEMLPGSALNLLDEVGSHIALSRPATDRSGEPMLVTEADVMKLARPSVITAGSQLAVLQPSASQDVPVTEASTCLLLGASYFKDPLLGDLPAVSSNILDLRQALTGRSGLFSAARVHPFDQLDRDSLVDIAELAEATSDTLLIYYAGHGLNEADDLYLAYTDTRAERAKLTGFGFSLLREIVLTSPATRRIVILDCCFAGKTIGWMAGDSAVPTGEVTIDGTYLLAATAAEQKALAPDGDRNTAFTASLLRLFEEGLPTDAEYISVSNLYPHLVRDLGGRNFPRPRQRPVDNIGPLAIARNPGRRAAWIT